jgi:hypothetical protein
MPLRPDKRALRREVRIKLLRSHTMIGENEQRWKELCAQAAIEQDPKKLVELTKEIDRLLAEKQSRLDNLIRNLRR